MEPLNRFPTMMQDYFMGRIRETEAAANARKFRLRTRSQALAYQQALRSRIRTIFGPRPRRVPFHERITGGFEREHYRVENLIFDTRPNFPVTANLYIPKDRPLPAPCVLGVCGHSMEGKGYDSYQAFCQGLATKGYVVLIFDPIGQGERLQYPNDEGSSRYGGTVGDHIQCANQQALLGEWFGSWRVWDGVRALDYLLSRPEADPRYVGLTGNSGGGTMTTWLAAADDRFTMAAPGCYVTTWRRNLENELPADSEQDPPRALEFGLDMDDFLAVHAPKPLILLTEALDMFDIRGSREVCERLTHLYTLLGKPENVQMVTGPNGHGYHQELREAMYGFFTRQCGKQREGSREPKREPEPQEQLWATKSGQVWELNADTVPVFTARKARDLVARRKPLQGDGLNRALARLLGVSRKPMPVPDYRFLTYGPPDRGYGKRATWYSVTSEPGIQVILTMVDAASTVPEIPAGKQTTLYIPHLSADEDLREDPLAQGLVQNTERMFAADLRGSGESRPNSCGGNYLAPYGSEYFYSYWSQMYGQSYLGRRVHDLLSVVELLSSRGYSKIGLVARGFGTLPALFAAVLDDRIKQVMLKNAPLSYLDIAQDEDYKWPLSSLLWGALRKLDLPDCYRALGKRLTLIEPWDAQCQPLPEDTVIPDVPAARRGGRSNPPL